MNEHMHHHPMHDHMHHHPMHRPVPQLLVLITDIDRKRAIADLFRDNHMRVFQCRGKGTATSEIMDILGLEATDKAVTICFTAKQVVPAILKKITGSLRLDKAGGGIAFTLPCSGIASPLMRMLEETARNQLQEHMESEVKLVKENATHEVIVAVINQGFSEELVEHAKKAGATGGTVIHASQVADTEKAKTWGITLHEEKEIVVMLVPREQKLAIMKAVCKGCGVATEAHGLVLSLPVDAVEGLGGNR